jgi:hypothetical protein
VVRRWVSMDTGKPIAEAEQFILRDASMYPPDVKNRGQFALILFVIRS